MSEQSKTSAFLRWAFGCSIGATFSLYFLDGWHLWGFYLSPPLLYPLGVSTIGQVAVIYRMALSGKQKKAP